MCADFFFRSEFFKIACTYSLFNCLFSLQSHVIVELKFGTEFIPMACHRTAQVTSKTQQFKVSSI